MALEEGTAEVTEDEDLSLVGLESYCASARGRRERARDVIGNCMLKRM